MNLQAVTASAWGILRYREPQSAVRQRCGLFLVAFLYGLLAVATASLLFPGAMGIVAVFLHSLSLLAAFDWILEKNGDDIWRRRIHPAHANLDMTLSLLVLFSGALCVYFTIALLMPAVLGARLFATQLEGAVVQLAQMHFAHFGPILAHNLVALLTFLFFALLYRAGAVFAVVWNASVWGAIFGVTTTQASVAGETTLMTASKLLCCTMPHLVAEAVAYILSAMAGMFLSKAMLKYRWSDAKFYQVLRACTVILLLALGTLLLAACLESQVAPWLVRRLFTTIPSP